MRGDLFVLAATLFAVAGCAQPGTTGAEAMFQSRAAVDKAYMDRVERIARMQGVEIHWLNPPVVLAAKGN